MRLLFILFALIFCLVNVNGRNLHEYNAEEQENTDGGESLKQIRDPTANQMRHRRRSRQSYGDYNPYHDYRRDYNRQQDEMYSQIMRLLDEISSNLRRITQTPPPPPPQPIYIPYPVPYPVPHYFNCKNNNPPKINTTDTPALPPRWPEMDDENQNWGLIPGDTNIADNDDGVRPISFDPIPPSTNVKSPPVEHGSSQAGMDASTTTPVKKPGTCKASVLKCCNFNNKEDQQACFVKDGCRNTFKTGMACSPQIIKHVLDEFAKAYAPNAV